MGHSATLVPPSCLRACQGRTTSEVVAFGAGATVAALLRAPRPAHGMAACFSQRVGYSSSSCQLGRSAYTCRCRHRHRFKQILLVCASATA